MRGEHGWSVIRNAVAILVASGLLAGCYARSIESSHRAALAKLAPQEAGATQSGAMVAVRWPIAIEEPAYETITDVFRRKLTPTLDLGGTPIALHAPRRIPEVSTYYALEFYAYLKQALGQDRVLLEPYVVAARGDGGLDYLPIFPGRLPVAVVVDVVEPPQWTAGLHAAYVQTSFRISTAPAVSPRTCGLLAGTEWQAKPGVGFEVRPVVGDERCNARTARRAPHYTFLDFLAPNAPTFAEEVQKNDALPLKANVVMTWPNTIFTLPGRRVQAIHAQPVLASPENEWSANMARVVAEALSALDLRAAVEAGEAEYAALYDAARTLTPERRAAVAALAEAERRWTLNQDEKIAQALLGGNFGRSFRQRRMADHRNLNSMRAMGFGPRYRALKPNAAADALHAKLAASNQYERSLKEVVAAELGAQAATKGEQVEVTLRGNRVELVADSRAKLRQQLSQAYRQQVLSASR